MKLSIVFIVLSYLTVNLEASGIFKVYLIRFNNPKGWESAKVVCDYFTQPCDTKFQIKLWSSTYSAKVLHTREYAANAVNFEINYNPISLHVSNYGGYMYLYVLAKDIDPIGYQTIDTYTIQMTTGNQGLLYERTYYGKYGHTWLQMKYIWVCNSNYYGALCNVYCSSTDRYYCNSQSGRRICKSGWLNPSNYCNTRDYCYYNPCKNGGQCKNEASSYSCSCINGYNGTDCEISPCHNNPCLNGGKCSPAAREANYYVCDCPMGYMGDRCEIEPQQPTTQPNATASPSRSNPCLNRPCQNGGNCRELMNDTREFQCHCPDGYTGEFCETSVSICERKKPCLNGGVCVAGDSDMTYSCNCTSNYTGFHCGHLKCGTLCYNGGRCNKINDTFQCICKNLYTGFDCKKRVVFAPSAQKLVITKTEYEYNYNVIYILVAAVVALFCIVVLVIFILHKKRVINVGETYQRLRHNSAQFYENHFRRASRSAGHVNVTYESDANAVYDEIQGNENYDNYYSTVHKCQDPADTDRVHITIEPTVSQSKADPYEEYSLPKESNSFQTSSNRVHDYDASRFYSNTLEEDYDYSDPEKAKYFSGLSNSEKGVSFVDEEEDDVNIYEDENEVNNAGAGDEYDEFYPK